MKKILALALALCMCACMSATAFAAEIDSSGGSGSHPCQPDLHLRRYDRRRPDRYCHERHRAHCAAHDHEPDR